MPPLAKRQNRDGEGTIHSLDAVIELLSQGDHKESETTNECKHEHEREVVNPIFDPIEKEPDEDGRKGVRFEVVVPVPHPSRDLRVMGARGRLHMVHKRQVHGRRGREAVGKRERLYKQSV